MAIPRKTRFEFDFIRNRNIAFIISIVFIVVGIGSIIVKGGFALGIDFAGGTLVEVRFSEVPAIEAIRSAILEAGFKDTIIQRLEDEHTVLIRVQQAESIEKQSQIDEGLDQGKKITSALQSSFSGTNFEVLKVEQIGPQIGSELRRSAQLALLFAIAGMILYISWRFESKFALPIALIGVVTIGLSSLNVAISLVIIIALIVLLIACLVFNYHFAFAAIVALIHDVFVTVGALSLTNREITITVIAAILTIIGYSVNDTIVIFDRIRENLRLIRTKDSLEVLNLSINQTLSRTILTSLTTLVVVLILLFIGGEALKGFAFAMLIGIITGTYSSVFVASPILYVWDRRVKGGIFKKA